MKTFIKNLRQKKEVRTFVWNTFNGIITLVSTLVLASKEPMLITVAPIIMSWLSLLTKHVNKKYFNDLWVVKE